MIFYVGLHHPGDAQHFERAFISVNTLRRRLKPVPCSEWIMDSGAFNELSNWGRYRHSVAEYAGEIGRWRGNGLIAAVTQDYMCEPRIIRKTGLSVAEHQRLTIERYDALLFFVHDVYVMPVLQGYTVADYLKHIDDYGERLGHGAWVGVGSICKRNGKVKQIEVILSGIKAKRPDLRLHGFGIKTTALGSGVVLDCLHSADSLAWSWAARRQGRNANDWREATRFIERIHTQPVQNGWAF